MKTPRHTKEESMRGQRTPPASERNEEEATARLWRRRCARCRTAKEEDHKKKEESPSPPRRVIARNSSTYAEDMATAEAPRVSRKSSATSAAAPSALRSPACVVEAGSSRSLCVSSTVRSRTARATDVTRPGSRAAAHSTTMRCRPRSWRFSRSVAASLEESASTRAVSSRTADSSEAVSSRRRRRMRSAASRFFDRRTSSLRW
mmetsp:Transcript_26564/g.106370  ORF Transcript_26564/g.106370 Transcript_26564/m.106370 type:complete len:204 (+) Transcript_26564:881-1492(+)